MNHDHKTSFCKIKERLFKKEIAKISKRESCKAGKGSSPDKKGRRGTIKTLPPTPNHAEQKPETKPKKARAKKGHSRIIFIPSVFLFRKVFSLKVR